MKLFIYKTLFVFLLIYLLFQLTIGLVVKKIKEEIYNFKYLSLDVDKAINDHDHHGYLKARDNQHFCGWWHRDVMEDFYKQYMQI